MSKEKLEETAEKIRKELTYAPIGIIPNFKDGFIEGVKSDVAKDYWYAKWQQEQDTNKHSEEELHNAFYNGWLYRGEEKYKFQFPQAKKEWLKNLKSKL